jgi:hypothetical protein
MATPMSSRFGIVRKASFLHLRQQTVEHSILSRSRTIYRVIRIPLFRYRMLLTTPASGIAAESHMSSFTLVYSPEGLEGRDPPIQEVGGHD